MRTKDRIRSEYRILTRMPIQDALLTLASQACVTLEGGEDHLGTMWEAAHAYMDGRAQSLLVRPNGSLMKAARQALSDLEHDHPCDDQFHIDEPSTPEQEVEARLKLKWLVSQIESHDLRTRTILRHGLGIDDEDDGLEIERVRSTISHQRISQIWRGAYGDLCRSWRADMERSLHLLDHGTTVVVLPDIVQSTGEPVKADIATDTMKTQRGSTDPKIEPSRKPRREPAPAGRDVLRIYDVEIKRIAQDAYSVDGKGSMDADAIGKMIHRLSDECHSPEITGLLRRRDLWLANGYQTARLGPQWPHPTGNVVRLTLSNSDA